jgi:hypothetical protein
MYPLWKLLHISMVKSRHESEIKGERHCSDSDSETWDSRLLKAEYR